MKKFKLVSILVLISFHCVYGQQEGIRFERFNNWQEVIRKAEQENKYIFVDAYTTWCGPCKVMDQNIFPSTEIGQYISDKFISVKIQLDKTVKDNDLVKAWYATADSFQFKYEISAFPTFLYFSPKGQIVHKTVGSVRSPQAFINQLKDAQNPDKQYYTLLRRQQELIAQYSSGKRSTPLLQKLTLLSIHLKDTTKAIEYGNEYIARTKNVYDKDVLEILVAITLKSKDKGFSILRKYPGKVNKVLGEGVVESKFIEISSREDQEIIKKLTAENPNWELLSRYLVKKYGKLSGDELTLIAKQKYAKKNKDWKFYSESFTEHVELTKESYSGMALNNCAWEMFKLSMDTAILQKALGWSRLSIEKEPEEPANYDTYANLLYKLGRVVEAIQFEQKAINMASAPGDKNEFEQALGKMRSGQPTWPVVTAK